MVRGMRTKLVASLCLITSCAASKGLQFEATTTATAPAAPAALVDDYFARDKSAQLAEGELKEVLAAPVFLETNARVGVVPIDPGFVPGARVPNEGVATQLASALEDSGLVELATEIAPDWPADRGLAGLRELAARYRCDYLLLYRHRLESTRRPNGWAALYVAVLPLFFVPGNSLESHGVLEASLFDVKTGTVLFTALERVHGEDLATLPGTDRTTLLMERAMLDRAAPKLAERVLSRLQRLAVVRPKAEGPAVSNK